MVVAGDGLCMLGHRVCQMGTGLECCAPRVQHPVITGGAGQCLLVSLPGLQRCTCVAALVANSCGSALLFFVKCERYNAALTRLHLQVCVAWQHKTRAMFCAQEDCSHDCAVVEILYVLCSAATSNSPLGPAC